MNYVRDRLVIAKMQTMIDTLESGLVFSSGIVYWYILISPEYGMEASPGHGQSTSSVISHRGGSRGDQSDHATKVKIGQKIGKLK